MRFKIMDYIREELGKEGFEMPDFTISEDLMSLNFKTGNNRVREIININWNNREKLKFQWESNPENKG